MENVPLQGVSTAMSDENHTDLTRRALLKAAGIATAGLATLGRCFGTAWSREGHAVQPQPVSQPVQAPGEHRSVWLRLTKRVRRIIFLAQVEAARFGTQFVGAEHLLLAMIQESECRGACVLQHLGINLDQVHRRLELRIRREPSITGAEMMLAPDGNQVIDNAMTEARLLGKEYVGSEHLLLALFKDEGLAGQVLHQLGASAERARRALGEEIGD
jgi:ClpA/ClpB-like protein